MIAWSYTRLKDFERCRRAFQLKYITKELPYKETTATKKGKRIHASLERLALAYIKGLNEFPAYDPIVHMYAMVQGFIKSHKQNYPEKKLAFKKDLSPCTWYSKEAWLRVMIDLAGVNPTYASIIDYKTGKVRVDMDQLRLYNIGMLLWRKEIMESHSALVFLDHKTSSKILTTKRSELEVELNEFSDRSEAIQIAVERDSWPPTPNYLCKWCDANVLQCEEKM